MATADFIFDTDVNYMKRDPSSGAGLVTLSGTPVITPVSHNLGFAPFFETYAELRGDGRIWNRNILYQGMAGNAAVSPSDPEVDAWTSTSALSVRLTKNGPGTGIRELYWLIYRDYGGLVDADAFFFNSDYPIDKVVDSGTFTATNAGPSSTSNYNADNIGVVTIPNTYGRRGLVRLVWSIDGTNFNTVQTELMYGFTIDATPIGGPVSSPLPGITAAVAAGCNDTDIQFQLINGSHGNLVQTSVSPTYTYTATPLTFTVKWALLEIA